MALIEFKDYPNTTTPLNAENLNHNFRRVVYKEDMVFDDYSDLMTLCKDVYANKDKRCIGGIGNLYDTNLRTLLGNPEIGNYTTCLFEHLMGAEIEGCIRVTAQAPYERRYKTAYIIYDSKGSLFTGWRGFAVEQVYLGQNPDIDSMRYRSGVYGIYNCSQAPDTAIGALEVLVYSNDWVVQRFTKIPTGEMWQRQFESGTTWTPWTKKW